MVTTTTTTTHIRPQKRRGNANRKLQSQDDDGSATTPLRMIKLPPPTTATQSLSAVPLSTTATTKSILKSEPKYSNKHSVKDAPTVVFDSREPAIVSEDEDDRKPAAVASSQPAPRSAPIVQSLVVERKKKKKEKKQQSNSLKQQPPVVISNEAGNIEGYTPQTEPRVRFTEEVKEGVAAGSSADTSSPFAGDRNDAANNPEPVVLNSLTDLMQLAGTLPEGNGNIDPGSVVEAQLSFQCMDPDTYRTSMEEARQAQYQACLGRGGFFGDGGGGDDGGDDAGDPSSADQDDDDDDDSFLQFDSNDDEEEETTSPRSQNSPFLILWNALAQWVTPQAVSFVRQLANNKDLPSHVPFDGSDLGLSRCAGLYGLLSIHTKAIWLKELKQDSIEELRRVERRMAELLQCLDYSHASPRTVLDSVDYIRALTCIFLEIVLVSGADTEVNAVPASCQALGLKLEEYRYLTRSALLNFGRPDDSEQSD